MELCEYVGNFPKGQYDSLLANDITQRIGKLSPVIGNIHAGQYILECLVSNPGVGGDFSIQITRTELPKFLKELDGGILRRWCEQTTAWSRVRELCLRWNTDPMFANMEDVWLEFDYEAFEAEIPLPCLFVDASGVCIEDALKGPISIMLGDMLTEDICSCLKNCSAALLNIGIFQLGVMLSRKDALHSVRLFANDMNINHIMPMLRDVKWGSEEERIRLEAFIKWAEDFSDGLYVLDLGISAKGLNNKIGICFSPAPGIQPLTALLEALESRGWAIPDKCCDIKDWIKHNDFLSLENNISHFKFPFAGDVLGVKVYLRNQPYKSPLLNPNSRW